MIDKGIWDKGFIWNPSNCECECDKSCDVGECLDYKNCKCRKRLAERSVEECSENFDEEESRSIELYSNKTIHYLTLNDYEKICSSCTGISISIDNLFIFFHWYLKTKYIEKTIYSM